MTSKASCQDMKSFLSIGCIQHSNNFRAKTPAEKKCIHALITKKHKDMVPFQTVHFPHHVLFFAT